MTLEEILIEANEKAISTAKKINSDKKDKGVIGLHDLYKDSVGMAEHIKYHAEKGCYPNELFAHRSPNQTEAEAMYIKNNFKQHTLPVYVDYRNTITRPFGDGNWNIEYKEEKDLYNANNLSFKNYVENELPIYGSVENFVKFILPDIKSIDANGFLGVRPKDIPLKLNSENEYIIDEDRLYEPTIFYYPSESVIDYKQNYYYLFLAKDKSNVLVNGKTKKEGCVFELYTETGVYFLIQEGEKLKYTFKIELFFEYDLPEIPVNQLMGIPKLIDSQILWQSPFIYATDLLDVALVNANWLQASINSCVFPVKVMYGQRCDFKDADNKPCQEGKIFLDGGQERICPSCYGSGLKSRLSPLGTLLLNPTTKFEEGEDKSSQAPLQYISPEIHTLEFISSKVDTDIQKARQILHLQTSNTQVKGSEEKTATGMAIDVKSMYAFIKPISDQIFMLYEWSLKNIGMQRYNTDFVEPTLTYPKTFDFKSAEDYLADISEAIKNNLPPSFIDSLLMNYLNAYYGDNVATTDIFAMIRKVDRLFSLSQDEINMKINKGTVSKWEDILHTSIIQFIDNEINLDADFLLKDFEYKSTKLIEKAKSIDDEISSKAVNDIYNSIVE